LNLYRYVSNDPLNRADPTGQQTCDCPADEAFIERASQTEALSREDVQTIQTQRENRQTEHRAEMDRVTSELQQQFDDRRADPAREAISTLAGEVASAGLKDPVVGQLREMAAEEAAGVAYDLVQPAAEATSEATGRALGETEQTFRDLQQNPIGMPRLTDRERAELAVRR